MLGRPLLETMIVRIPVRGSSMRPSLTEGDEVVVRLAHGAECRVGDVVLVLQGTATVLHRVVARSATRVWTRGDALPHLDHPVALERVLGIAKVPRARLRSALLGMAGLTRATIFGNTRKWLRSLRSPAEAGTDHVRLVNQ